MCAIKNSNLLHMKTLLSTLIIVVCLSGYSQPNTEVYLFDLNKDDNGYSISNPVNISDNEGYDNQPSFWPDGESLIYARTVKGQTDIARYQISTGQTSIITKTLQGSEYSPTPTPDGRISSIRLDTTGLQLLYSYDLEGNEEVLVRDLIVGYHAWINSTDIVAFVLGEPATMQIIDTKTNESLVVGDKIGRSLHKIPNAESFSYVDKSKTPWMIKSMEPKSGKTRTLIETLEGAEDYCWTTAEEIIMGKGTKLWIWSTGDEWKSFADLDDFDMSGSISRISMSPNGDKIAVVLGQ